MKGPCVSQRKTTAQPFTLSRCTSRAGCHCSSARFNCQLSGKAHEDSDRTIMIAVLYWHLPSWRNCEHCNNFFGPPFGIPFARFDSLWRFRRLMPRGILPLGCFVRFLYLFVHPLFPELFGNLRTLINSYS